MNHVRAKLLAGGLVVAAAVAYLGVAGIREGWVYYLPVDEYLADPGYRVQRVRLHGTVGADDMAADRSAGAASFDLLGADGRIRVEYRGSIPDMFQSGREVVVEGRLDDREVFRADTLLTKCASKYETADGEAPHADPRGAGSTE